MQRISSLWRHSQSSTVTNQLIRTEGKNKLVWLFDPSYRIFLEINLTKVHNTSLFYIYFPKQTLFADKQFDKSLAPFLMNYNYDNQIKEKNGCGYIWRTSYLHTYDWEWIVPYPHYILSYSNPVHATVFQLLNKNGLCIGLGLVKLQNQFLRSVWGSDSFLHVYLPCYVVQEQSPFK